VNSGVKLECFKL